MRDEFLPFHRPSVGAAEIEAVSEVLRSGWLTTGPRVKQFEEQFAEYVGARHAIALNSGTAALHLSLAAIGLSEGDEVIVPSNTFTASAEVVTYFGARPVLVDVDRETLNLDVAAMEAAITAATRAVIAVHFGGQPCEMDALLPVARSHGLAVIEDAAHALPSAYRGRTIGTIGDFTAFSFYATKTLTTAEGGMITTNDDQHVERIRRLSLHGISEGGWERGDAGRSWFYEVMEPGFKYNMPDIAAAIGIEQLRQSDEFRERRRQIAAAYTRAFASTEAIGPPAVRDDVKHSWHLYVILLDLDRLAIDRDQFVSELRQRNIGTSVHFIPLHLHPHYQHAYGYAKGDFPAAEWVYDRSISLPIFPSMTDDDVRDVTDALLDIARQHRR